MAVRALNSDETNVSDSVIKSVLDEHAKEFKPNTRIQLLKQITNSKTRVKAIKSLIDLLYGECSDIKDLEVAERLKEIKRQIPDKVFESEINSKMVKVVAKKMAENLYYNGSTRIYAFTEAIPYVELVESGIEDIVEKEYANIEEREKLKKAKKDKKRKKGKDDSKKIVNTEGIKQVKESEDKEGENKKEEDTTGKENKETKDEKTGINKEVKSVNTDNNKKYDKRELGLQILYEFGRSIGRTGEPIIIPHSNLFSKLSIDLVADLIAQIEIGCGRTPKRPKEKKKK